MKKLYPNRSCRTNSGGSVTIDIGIDYTGIANSSTAPELLKYASASIIIKIQKVIEKLSPAEAQKLSGHYWLWSEAGRKIMSAEEQRVKALEFLASLTPEAAKEMLQEIADKKS